MAEPQHEWFMARRRGNLLRLRTLNQLRWIAIAGQSAALIAANFYFGLRVPSDAIIATIGLSVGVNLVTRTLLPENRILSEREATAFLVFDSLQLGLLLALTGGLNNPFALLTLVPVAIAATVADRSGVFLIGALTVAIVTLTAFFHIDVGLPDGGTLVLPATALLGFWVALVIGSVFLGAYAHSVTSEMDAMRDALAAAEMALAREQKLTDMGGVVAAAAHELGTPLATIKLVSGELADELEGHDELRADLALIRQEADRCGAILRSMGRAGKDDLLLRRAPVEVVVREAAEPHMSRGKSVELHALADIGAAHEQPVILRRPEILHGLRNLIQNAVDFAASSVDIDVSWSETSITVRIADDGPGYPPGMIGRIGEPFMRNRPRGDEVRPGYEGMGLGLFIAKTLLERSGGSVDFANVSTRAGGLGGAMVMVRWARAGLEVGPNALNAGLGENQPFADGLG